MEKRKKYLIGAGALLIVVLIAGLIFYIRSPHYTAGRGMGSATGKSAAMEIEAMYGQSRVETLADRKDCPSGEDALQYLVDNSIFLLDQQYVEQRAEAEYLAMESAADASGMTYSDYVASTNGGMSTTEYEAERKKAHEQFVKERLVAYELARKENLAITTAEYEKLLPEYAAAYGYSDAEQFEQECDKDSIASEMLFEKVCDWLGAGEANAS